VAHGLVFVGSDDDKLYAFDAAGCGQSTCSSVWTATTGDWVESSPAVAYGMVFVGSDDHNVYAFDAATGALEWVVPTGDQLTLASPAVANGVVYMGGNDGVVRAIEARSGQVLWTYTTGSLVGGGPVVAKRLGLRGLVRRPPLRVPSPGVVAMTREAHSAMEREVADFCVSSGPFPEGKNRGPQPQPPGGHAAGAVVFGTEHRASHRASER